MLRKDWKLRVAATLALVAVAGWVGTASASVWTNGASGSEWTTFGNWDGVGFPPTAADDVVIDAVTNGTVNMNGTTFANRVNMNQGTINMQSGTFTLSPPANGVADQDFRIAQGGNSATVNMSGDAFADLNALGGSSRPRNLGRFIVGDFAGGGTGTLNMSGNSRVEVGKLHISGGGTAGRLNMSDNALLIVDAPYYNAPESDAWDAVVTLDNSAELRLREPLDDSGNTYFSAASAEGILQHDIDFNQLVGAGGQSVQIQSVSDGGGNWLYTRAFVPEPGSLAMLGLASGWLLMNGRKRRNG